MASRKLMKGALAGFVGTLKSRYSDFDGYWIYGMLLPQLQRLQVDLLVMPVVQRAKSPEAALLERARETFRDQSTKAGIPLAIVKSASLVVERGPGPSSAQIGAIRREGYDVTLTASAEMDNGRRYSWKETIFVAPHDPDLELRSARARDRQVGSST